MKLKSKQITLDYFAVVQCFAAYENTAVCSYAWIYANTYIALPD